MTKDSKLIASGTYGCVVIPPITKNITEVKKYTKKSKDDIGKLFKANKIKSLEKIIIELKKKFNHYRVDGYIIPKNDEYFSEFAINDKLKTITNFNGSFGLAVILKKKNFLFVLPISKTAVTFCFIRFFLKTCCNSIFSSFFN